MRKHKGMIFGVDPGKQGGIACLFPNGSLQTAPMPVNKKTGQYEHEAFVDLFGRATPNSFAAVEELKSWKGDKIGKANVFKMGYGVGIIHTALAICGIPWIEIDPQDWQADIESAKKLKGDIKKFALIEECSRRHGWPTKAEICNATDGRKRSYYSGQADAALIAHYAAENFSFEKLMEWSGGNA
jgi:hypothetical protein